MLGVAVQRLFQLLHALSPATIVQVWGAGVINFACGLVHDPFSFGPDNLPTVRKLFCNPYCHVKQCCFLC